ncbi:AfsR/SARP family transcriptional regulator [Deinococcus cellulosilyticus]|uniref:Bacterial transcriptional activator domain-containing protein n=1 Tax=Deinococcus cellulosilyticus (strain DSM 18568 / NBRC 106333 / KACC 11606 / 5516J-15) TaxID=1223518 RepID=A0A511NAN7_DEIC1|nr:BTAD domain-containing putative transcriptional regulator [Deinococcus cellulosilyticus]GEM49894.1 hypothetical protein DC3_55290 [Deinococcus cellulosilyticus NBRC 106333 = KACC 11606]
MNASPPIQPTEAQPFYLEVHTLGVTRVLLNGHEPQWHAQGAREVFFYLLSHPAGRTRDQVVREVWNVEPGTLINTRFRVTVFRIRQALQAQDSVLEEQGVYRLNDLIVQGSDVQRFRSGLNAARRHTDPALQLQVLQDTLEHYQGLYLCELSSEWVLAMRADLQGKQARALLHLARLLCERLDCKDSIAARQQALHADPYLGEHHHQDLMRCLTQKYSKFDAIEHYRRFVLLLRTEVQDTPMPETQQLAEDIKQNHTLAHPCTPKLLDLERSCVLRQWCGQRDLDEALFET